MAALLLTLALMPQSGHAAGFEFPDNGTQALGRGGAFAAKADDPTAILHNLAGLAKLSGTHLLVDLHLCNLSSTFSRSGVYPDDTYLDAARQEVTQPWSGQPFPTVENSVGIFPLPMGAITSDFGLRTFTFAVGAFGPSSVGERKFPDTVRLPGTAIDAPAPQRFDLVDEDVLIAYITFAAAWRAWSWLDLGAAFHWGVAHVREHVYAMAYTNPNECRSGEAWACSTRAGIDVWDSFAPTGSVSALVRPLDHLEVGLSFRLPFSIEASGDGSMSLPPALSNFEISATTAVLKTDMPYVLRSGVRYYFGSPEDERGDVELDVIYEGWSRVGTFTTTFGTTLGEIEVDVPHHYRDTVSLRLGGAYNLRLGRARLPLRGGCFYETAAAPDEWSRLDFDAFARVGVTLGAGFTFRGVTVNAAGAYIHMPQRRVSGSLATPIYAIGEAPAGQPGLDGTFTTRLFVFSLGAAVSFDELLGRGRGRR